MKSFFVFCVLKIITALVINAQKTNDEIHETHIFSGDRDIPYLIRSTQKLNYNNVNSKQENKVEGQNIMSVNNLPYNYLEVVNYDPANVDKSDIGQSRRSSNSNSGININNNVSDNMDGVEINNIQQENKEFDSQLKANFVELLNGYNNPTDQKLDSDNLSQEYAENKGSSNTNNDVNINNNVNNNKQKVEINNIQQKNEFNTRRMNIISKLNAKLLKKNIGNSYLEANEETQSSAINALPLNGHTRRYKNSNFNTGVDINNDVYNNLDKIQLDNIQQKNRQSRRKMGLQSALNAEISQFEPNSVSQTSLINDYLYQGLRRQENSNVNSGVNINNGVSENWGGVQLDNIQQKNRQNRRKMGLISALNAEISQLQPNSENQTSLINDSPYQGLGGKENSNVNSGVNINNDVSENWGGVQLDNIQQKNWQNRRKMGLQSALNAEISQLEPNSVSQTSLINDYPYQGLRRQDNSNINSGVNINNDVSKNLGEVQLDNIQQKNWQNRRKMGLQSALNAEISQLEPNSVSQTSLINDYPYQGLRRQDNSNINSGVNIDNVVSENWGGVQLDNVQQKNRQNRRKMGLQSALNAEISQLEPNSVSQTSLINDYPYQGLRRQDNSNINSGVNINNDVSKNLGEVQLDNIQQKNRQNRRKMGLISALNAEISQLQPNNENETSLINDFPYQGLERKVNSNVNSGVNIDNVVSENWGGVQLDNVQQKNRQSRRKMGLQSALNAEISQLEPNSVSQTSLINDYPYQGLRRQDNSNINSGVNINNDVSKNLGEVQLDNIQQKNWQNRRKMGLISALNAEMSQLQPNNENETSLINDFPYQGLERKVNSNVNSGVNIDNVVSENWGGVQLDNVQQKNRQSRRKMGLQSALNAEISQLEPNSVSQTSLINDYPYQGLRRQDNSNINSGVNINNDVSKNLGEVQLDNIQQKNSQNRRKMGLISALNAEISQLQPNSENETSLINDFPYQGLGRKVNSNVNSGVNIDNVVSENWGGVQLDNIQQENKQSRRKMNVQSTLDTQIYQNHNKNSQLQPNRVNQKSVVNSYSSQGSTRRKENSNVNSDVNINNDVYDNLNKVEIDNIQQINEGNRRRMYTQSTLYKDLSKENEREMNLLSLLSPKKNSQENIKLNINKKLNINNNLNHNVQKVVISNIDQKNKDTIKKMNVQSILNYFSYFIHHPPKDKDLNTLKRKKETYMTMLNYFIKYLGEMGVPDSEIVYYIQQAQSYETDAEIKEEYNKLIHSYQNSNQNTNIDGLISETPVTIIPNLLEEISTDESNPEDEENDMNIQIILSNFNFFLHNAPRDDDLSVLKEKRQTYLLELLDYIKYLEAIGVPDLEIIWYLKEAQKYESDEELRAIYMQTIDTYTNASPNGQQSHKTIPEIDGNINSIPSKESVVNNPHNFVQSVNNSKSPKRNVHSSIINNINIDNHKNQNIQNIQNNHLNKKHREVIKVKNIQSLLNYFNYFLHHAPKDNNLDALPNKRKHYLLELMEFIKYLEASGISNLKIVKQLEEAIAFETDSELKELYWKLIHKLSPPSEEILPNNSSEKMENESGTEEPSPSSEQILPNNSSEEIDNGSGNEESSQTSDTTTLWPTEKNDIVIDTEAPTHNEMTPHMAVESTTSSHWVPETTPQPNLVPENEPKQPVHETITDSLLPMPIDEVNSLNILDLLKHPHSDINKHMENILTNLILHLKYNGVSDEEIQEIVQMSLLNVISSMAEYNIRECHEKILHEIKHNLQLSLYKYMLRKCHSMN